MTIAVAARSSSITLPGLPADASARPRASLSGLRTWWARISFWPAELLRLIAVVYMLPIAIYAIGIVIGIPIAVAANLVLFFFGWSWKALWQ